MVSLTSLRREFEALGRPTAEGVPSDPVAFARSLGIEPDPWQEEVLSSPAKQKLLCASRQSGKTLVAAILAVHKALLQPGSVTLILAPTERQSKLLFSKAARLYRQAGAPARAFSDRRTGLELSNGSVLEALPAVERNTRGYSCDLLLLDEAAAVEDGDYFGLQPSLAVTRGDQLLCSTPRGKRGFFADIYFGEDEDWFKTTVTANETPRIRPETLESFRRRMPQRWFEQEFLCRFLDTDDAVFAHDLVTGAVTDEVEAVDFTEVGW